MELNGTIGESRELFVIWMMGLAWSLLRSQGPRHHLNAVPHSSEPAVRRGPRAQRTAVTCHSGRRGRPTIATGLGGCHGLDIGRRARSCKWRIHGGGSELQMA